jgi:Ca2+/H+ antiporter
MSSEPTSSVTAVTTSSLVTTAAPVTTTVNNPPVNENVLYDDKSKGFMSVIIIVSILIIIRAVVFGIIDKNNLVGTPMIILNVFSIILPIMYIIFSVLLINNYGKIIDEMKENISNKDKDKLESNKKLALGLLIGGGVLLLVIIVMSWCPKYITSKSLYPDYKSYNTMDRDPRLKWHDYLNRSM